MPALWKIVKRIVRYLQHTADFGLLLQPAPFITPLHMTAFCDADWVFYPDDRRSTFGCGIYFGPNLVSLRSKKQSVVGRSCSEAGYHSLALTAAKITWMQFLITELRISVPTPVIFCDNQSTVSLCYNPVLHS